MNSNTPSKCRLWFQILFTAVTNGYVLGFAKGKIYQGAAKQMCVPGLNCYSCPGAIGSCPIGALQAVATSKNFNISFYVLGFLMIVGSLVGRFVCGWMCPFGLIQELLHKIPFPKKIKTFKGERHLLKLKYIILIVFVILLPIAITYSSGYGKPWFCKLICPSGTLLGGVPLVAKSLKKGEYITTWVSVYEDDSAKNLTVDGYAIFKNAEKNDSPDKLPSLIKIKKIEKQKDKIKIKDDSEFSWIIPKNATIKLLNGKTAGPRDLKKGQRCLGYIDSKKSTRTKETEVVASKLLIVK